MKKKSAVPFASLLVLVFLSIQGCRASPGIETPEGFVLTPQVFPTGESVQAGILETPEAPVDTGVSPIEIVDPPAPSPFDPSTARYDHPEQIFRFYPPRGWQPVEETAESAWFSDPDQREALRIIGTNTGYRLEAEAFERFVQARDRNQFGIYQNLKEVEKEINPTEGTARIQKSFLLENIPYQAVSYYQQYDQAVFILDYWGEEPLFESRSSTIPQFFSNIRVDAEALASQEPYHLTFDFKNGSGLFTFKAPISWTYDTLAGDFINAYTFSSPDEHVLVQMVAYNDGEPITRVAASKLALELLRKYYADDVKILEDRVFLPEGLERLTWYSTKGDYRGVSQFELKGNDFLLLTVKYDNSYGVYYTGIIDRIVSSYDIP